MGNYFDSFYTGIKFYDPLSIKLELGLVSIDISWLNKDNATKQLHSARYFKK